MEATPIIYQTIFDCTCGNKAELEIKFRAKPYPLFTARVYCPKCGQESPVIEKVEENMAREGAACIWNRMVRRK